VKLTTGALQQVFCACEYEKVFSSPPAFTGADIMDMIHCLVMGWTFSASWIRTKGSMWLEIQQGQLKRQINLT